MRRGTGYVLGLTLLVAAFGVVVPGTVVPQAAADIPPPPDPPKTKRVRVEIQLDWGVLADRVPRRYVVEKGDTLSAIAQKHCGTKDRWQAIADANPDVVRKPDVIAAGATLWLPPMRAFDPPAAAGTPADPNALAPWYDAFWMRSIDKWRSEPGERAAATDDPWPIRSAGLCLIDHAVTEAALKLLRDESRGFAAAPRLERVRYTSFSADGLVHADEPTVRIVARYRITGIDAHSVKTTVETKRYDLKGQVVEKILPIEGHESPFPADPKPAEPKPADPKSDDPKMLTADDIAPTPVDGDTRWSAGFGVIVAVLGAAVVGGIVFLRRRRTK